MALNENEISVLVRESITLNHVISGVLNVLNHVISGVLNVLNNVISGAKTANWRPCV